MRQEAAEEPAPACASRPPECATPDSGRCRREPIAEPRRRRRRHAHARRSTPRPSPQGRPAHSRRRCAADRRRRSAPCAPHPDHRTRLAEVRLPMAGWMGQRHEHLPPPAVMLAHIVLHDRVAAAEPVLGAKPVEDTLGRVALLAQLLQILLQPLIDDLSEPVQLRAPEPVPSADSPEAPKSTASSSRSRAKSRNEAPPHARSSRPGRRDGPSDKVPRYACPRPPRRREGLKWQSFAPPAARQSRRYRGLISHRRSHLLLSARIRRRAAW